MTNPSHELSFDLTDESMKDPSGLTLYRIRATRDIPGQGVAEGDLGGWVSTARLEDGTARISGNAWVHEDAWVYNNARVMQDATIRGEARVCDNAQVRGAAVVSGVAWVYENSAVYNGAHISGSAEVSGSALVGGDAEVSGNASVYANAEISGRARVYGEAGIYGYARIYDEADIAEEWHCITVGPIGPRNVTATVFRMLNDAHRVDLDTWEGNLDTFTAEVDRLRESWEREGAAQARLWARQLVALRELGEATVAQWAETASGDSAPN